MFTARFRHPLGARQGPSVERFDVDLGTVEYRKSAILPLERKAEVGAAEDDGLGALYPAEVLADREKCPSLCVGNAPLDRHGDVVGVRLFQSIALGRDNVRRGNSSIE